MFFEGYWFVNSLHSTIIYCVISLFTISGNAMVIAAFWFDPFRQLKGAQNYFIMNLAISDLLMGAVAEPLLICTYWKEDDRIFLAHYLFAVVSGASSLLNITALSIVRYIAVNKPFSQQIIVTRKTVLVSITFIWVLSLHFVVLVLAGWNSSYYQLYLYGLGCFVPALIISFAYIGVFRAIRKHTRTLKKMDSGRGQALRNAVRAEKSTTKTVLLVLVVFLVFWVPFLAVDLIMVQWPNSRSVHFHFVRDVALTLTYFSSGVNPVLYTWRVRQFRRAFLRIIGCQKRRRSLTRERSQSQSAQTATIYFSFAGLSARYVVRQEWPEKV